MALVLPPAPSKGKFTQVAPQRKNRHGIPDYRLEVPNFQTVEEWADGKLRYNVKGDFSAPAAVALVNRSTQQRAVHCDVSVYGAESQDGASA